MLRQSQAQYTPPTRPRDSTVELSRVGGVNTPVGSRAIQFTISCAVKELRLVTSDDIVTSLLKKLSMGLYIDQYSRSKTAMESPLSTVSFQIVDRIRRQCVLGIRLKQHQLSQAHE